MGVQKHLALYNDGTVTPTWKGKAPSAADCSGLGVASDPERNVPRHRHQNSSRLACERASFLAAYTEVFGDGILNVLAVRIGVCTINPVRGV
jgi:hypothetical protein